MASCGQPAAADHIRFTMGDHAPGASYARAMAGASSDVRTHAGVTFTCGHCGASLLFAGVRTEACPYCASPNFVERPPSVNQPRPALVVAFTGDARVAQIGRASWRERV